jgi:RNA polymerase sigma factor (sigma-70 family)
MSEISTAELVHRAANGDDIAWRQLIDRYNPMLWHVARTYRLGDAQTADAVATAWMRLFEHIASLRDGQAAGGWLATTVRRECLAGVGRYRQERPVDELGREVGSADPSLDQRLMDADRRRVVAAAVARLPRPQRMLLALLFTDPAPSYREISTRLSIPIGSIGPTRRRILSKLREMLAGEEQELLRAS